ncbi:MAG: polyprenyl synthetase family protein [Candidatus Saccharibacteria bacterium]|nr:polyprenyl synthetase family protein [Candidatus Saccharibacteria bacterium]
MKTVSDDFDAIAAALSSLNAQLQRVATTSIPGLERILASAGKRQRPKLLFTIVQCAGKPIDSNVINAACAVELVHIASLIHDDILDKGTVRRGVQTISAVEGTDTALLAGDYLLAQACIIAARIDAACGQIVADTIIQMCKGQAQEITSRYDVKRTLEDLITSVEGKTASLFVASALLGGKLVQVSQPDEEALQIFAKNYGIAYQFQDDIQDFYQTKSGIGKTANYDYVEGNYTLPILLALSGPDRPRLKRLLEQASTHQQVVALLDKGDYFSQAESQIQRYKNQATVAIEKIANERLLSALSAFATAL